MAETPGGFSVYLLRCADDSLYTGIATDVRRRLREHRQGGRGARYLRGRAPFELVVAVMVGSRSDASRVEHGIKRLSKAEKEDLAGRPAALRAFVRSFLNPEPAARVAVSRLRSSP